MEREGIIIYTTTLIRAATVAVHGVLLLTVALLLILMFPSVAYATYETQPFLQSIGLPPLASQEYIPWPVSPSQPAVYMFEVDVNPQGSGISVSPDPITINWAAVPANSPTFIWLVLPDNLCFSYPGGELFWSFQASNPWSGDYPQGLTYGCYTCPSSLGLSGWEARYYSGIPPDPILYEMPRAVSLRIPPGITGRWKYTITIVDASGRVVASLDPILNIINDPNARPMPATSQVSATTTWSLIATGILGLMVLRRAIAKNMMQN